MSRYRNTRTGAVRESTAHLGYPYLPEDEAEAEVRRGLSYRELQATAKAKGIPATGSRDDLEAALATPADDLATEATGPAEDDG